MNTELYEKNYRKMVDVVDCVVNSKGNKVTDKGVELDVHSKTG